MIITNKFNIQNNKIGMNKAIFRMKIKLETIKDLTAG